MTRSLSRLAAVAAILASTLALLAGVAQADGDPASDVLASQSLFLPSDAGVPVAEQGRISGLLTAASRSGYQIRVAMIASPMDLGSVSELWQQPANYARFLGLELSFVYRGPLLVVMPAGYGLYGFGGRVGTAREVVSGLGSPRGRLAPAMLVAVQRLAAAAGHPLAVPNTAPAARPAPGDVLPWVVFALGAALIVAAWSASLRARPLRAGPRDA